MPRFCDWQEDKTSVDRKKNVVYELWVKFYLGQNEDCGLGDSIQLWDTSLFCPK